jgi:Uma2 family endonuclease
MMQENTLKPLTYGDLLATYPNERVELIDGVAVFMSGVINLHTRITEVITSNIYAFRTLWKKKKTKENKPKYFTFHAPFDVILFPDNEDISLSKIVVQPDIGVALMEKCHKTYIKGAPELVIEVTSSNITYDFKTKYDLYEKAGVKEYWIIIPKEKLLIINTLLDGKYEAEHFQYDEEEMTVKSKTLEGFEVPLHEVFDYTGLE